MCSKIDLSQIDWLNSMVATHQDVILEGADVRPLIFDPEFKVNKQPDFDHLIIGYYKNAPLVWHLPAWVLPDFLLWCIQTECAFEL